MTRNSMVVLGFVAIFVGLANCSSEMTPSAVDPTPAVEARRPSVGALMHQGRMYDLRDLMNADYRAASDDEFVKDFNPNSTYAETAWAGLSHSGFNDTLLSIGDN